MTGNDLVGAWELMSMESLAEDGQVVFPWGRDVTGRLFYTADGWMAAYIAKANRPPFVAGDILSGLTEEVIAAAQSWISYCGHYTYQDGVVTHHVEISFFPNWVGGEQKRHVQLAEPTLTLTTAPILQNGNHLVTKLIWKRVR